MTKRKTGWLVKWECALYPWCVFDDNSEDGWDCADKRPRKPMTLGQARVLCGAVNRFTGFRYDVRVVPFRKARGK